MSFMMTCLLLRSCAKNYGGHHPFTRLHYQHQHHKRLFHHLQCPKCTACPPFHHAHKVLCVCVDLPIVAVPLSPPPVCPPPFYVLLQLLLAYARSPACKANAVDLCTHRSLALQSSKTLFMTIMMMSAHVSSTKIIFDAPVNITITPVG